MECPFALVEAGARPGARSRHRLPRHDALGVRFRAGRAPSAATEVPAETVQMEVLEGATGQWRPVPAAGLAAAALDPTLRAYEVGAAGPKTPLRSVALGKTPGTVRIRRRGGERRELAQLCGADAKQSRGDLQAWLRDAPKRLRGVQFFFIVAPAGLARAEELPPKVGLAEVDLERLLGPDGEPAIRVARWPESLRAGVAWDEARTVDFQRHAYYAMHGLFGRRLFWFLAQQALDRRRAARTAAEAPPRYREPEDVRT